MDVSVDAWFALYNFATTLVEENCIDNDIYDIISNPAITGTTNKSFVFKVSLTVLNQRIQKNSENGE